MIESTQLSYLVNLQRSCSHSCMNYLYHTEVYRNSLLVNIDVRFTPTLVKDLKRTITHGRDQMVVRGIYIENSLVTRFIADDFFHEITIVDRRIYKETTTKHCRKWLLTETKDRATLIKFWF